MQAAAGAFEGDQLSEGGVVLLAIFDRIESLEARFEIGDSAADSDLAKSSNDARHIAFSDFAIGSNRLNREFGEERLQAIFTGRHPAERLFDEIQQTLTAFRGEAQDDVLLLRACGRGSPFPVPLRRARFHSANSSVSN